ncbi:alpha-hydroxy-acid oxidizing protein [Thermanaeromonas sp. C210]|uniref:alpha-hydroxy-acid oxidizing protein n=1 Tax=Thermanaeromonas sp. C210 TaxID=2731925 RepID=UPI00155CACA2|nr:alpha-hydroxy-acid oxidizing protein [Thermanaeromonas sp. C210]GFN23930.1 alpha-hydroxy-acid oxidizing enzyme [Thermanaeromonas sp. C210]
MEKKIKRKAFEILKGICSVCPVCDGRRCPTGVPGMGGVGTGEAFRRNIEALKGWKVNLRVLHDKKEQDTCLKFLGCSLPFPILAAPVTGTKVNFGGRMKETDLARAMVQGAKLAGTLAMTGDAPDPEVFKAGLIAVREAGGWGIPVIKPRANKEIIALIRQAEEAGATAVGIDVDAAGFINMVRAGQLVEPKSVADIREIVRATSLPVILKGIMTVADAEAAVEGGAAAIVVSNHGGRALDHTLGTAEALPGIAGKVKGKIAILADGGIRTGVDVLKMLALGAEAVLVGRPLCIAACGGGAEGVHKKLLDMASELQAAMRLTGCGTLQDVNCSILKNV